MRSSFFTFAFLISALTLSLSPYSARAASADSSGNSTESPSASKAKVPIPAPSRADIDEEITNARLRAATGAKSLVSLQSQFYYNGSTINHPLAKERPQLSPGTVENDPAKLTGAISGKYRATDHDNINVGVGVGWVTPTYEGQRGQVEDPYIAYGRVFKSGIVQNALNVQFLKYTVASAVEQSKLNFETDIDHTFLVPVGGDGKTQLGLVLAWYREFYTQSTGGQQDTFAAYPFGEYEFNKTFSFRTVYRGLTYFNKGSDSTLVHDDPTQSAGIGISIARDFYLYPNVQWVWGDMRPDKTNVALQANINL